MLGFRVCDGRCQVQVGTRLEFGTDLGLEFGLGFGFYLFFRVNGDFKERRHLRAEACCVRSLIMDQNSPDHGAESTTRPRTRPRTGRVSGTAASVARSRDQMATPPRPITCTESSDVKNTIRVMVRVTIRVMVKV